MFVILRIVSLLLIVAALMLLGADAISSLENGGKLIVRSLDQVWSLFDKPGVDAFHVWLGRHLPGPLPAWIGAIFSIPAWAATGVPGAVLAFLFGRAMSEPK
ncbi:MAG TPA: hypothetical protein VMJ73_11060 [Rhizomicrobium sp.]|nr:hypothetical protein [Rhizomicrobium sp.]